MRNNKFILNAICVFIIAGFLACTDETTASDSVNSTTENSDDTSDDTSDGSTNDTLYVADGAELTLVQSNFNFTEGPTADSEGNVYFSDITGGKIYKWSYEDNSITLYKTHNCKPNGLMFTPNEQLVICEMSNSIKRK